MHLRRIRTKANASAAQITLNARQFGNHRITAVGVKV